MDVSMFFSSLFPPLDVGGESASKLSHPPRSSGYPPLDSAAVRLPPLTNNREDPGEDTPTGLNNGRGRFSPDQSSTIHRFQREHHAPGDRQGGRRRRTENGSRLFCNHGIARLHLFERRYYACRPMKVTGRWPRTMSLLHVDLFAKCLKEPKLRTIKDRHHRLRPAPAKVTEAKGRLIGTFKPALF